MYIYRKDYTMSENNDNNISMLNFVKLENQKNIIGMLIKKY